MFVITHRSLVFAATALFTVVTSVAAAQEVKPPADPSRSQPSSRSDATAGDDDDTELVLAEPDFRVLNLPSTLRLPRHGSSFQLTHRFNGNLRSGSFGENASNLFGLDLGAAVGFEYRFGIARHLQGVVYRTAIDKTFQFYGKYDAVRQNDSVPVSLSALISVEGTDNFQEHYSPALGAAVSRMVADRLAESFAEVLHAQVRNRLWGYADEHFSNEQLIREKYQGIRPAPGYPACPDHSLKPILFDMLGGNPGEVTLTENFAMLPTSAVSGFYFGHRDSQYFGVARIGRDQLDDYAGRRGASVECAERWLRPSPAVAPAAARRS